MPRTMRPMRTCATEGCNRQFESSPTDYTVNCPEHRGRTVVRVSKSPDEYGKVWDEHYRLGWDDGKKRGDKPGFSGYRKAAFGWSGAKLAGYEAGFRDARDGRGRRA